ncbi:MAG: type III PLP-dependent enzyme [Acidimicrobiia bacterium]|nr:type III PLP-dependent enzyme [Acidimicrobiia bacterium]
MSPLLSEITPALRTFLDTSGAPTPFVVVDVDVVERLYRELCSVLPAARALFAVKANPAEPIIRRLAALGSGFDVASPAEIDLCLAAGAEPSVISYGNTIKKSADIAYAIERGVRTFTIDSPEELAKIAALTDEAEICVRLWHDCGGADWPLSRKFGTGPAQCERLIRSALAHGFTAGMSFHVGSQQRSPHAWDTPLRTVGAIRSSLRADGFDLSFVNLGGGFPGSYTDPVAPIADYGREISDSVARWVGTDMPLFMEPGRYLVADAGVLRAEVVLVSQRDIDERRWVYLDCGVFHGLAETLDEAIAYRVRASGGSGPLTSVVLAGPTCDSMDILYDKNDVRLPSDLSEGDHVEFLSAGAYTTTYSSVGFNGIAPLAEHYVNAD